MKKYKIQGVTLSQGEMTLGKDKQIIKLWDRVGVDLESLTASKTVQEMVSWLMSSGILEEFLDIILDGDTDKVAWDDLTNSELEEIITDFFVLNAKWIGKLRDFLTSLAQGSHPETE